MILLAKFRFFNKLLRIFKGYYYSKYIDSGGGEFRFNSADFNLKIFKNPNSKLVVKGIVTLESFLGGEEVTSISLEEGSTLEIESDFDLGSGVKIACAPDSNLFIGGKRNEKGSGITSDSKIICKKNIYIGYDFICSWDVYISDFDSHYVENSSSQSDIKIGDHVWITQRVTILKGSQIGGGSIVATGAVVKNGEYKANSLLGGIPAKILRENISWERDLK